MNDKCSLLLLKTMLSMLNGQGGGHQNAENLGDRELKKKKKSELTGPRTGTERCRSWNSRLDIYFSRNVTGKNRKRRASD